MDLGLGSLRLMLLSKPIYIPLDIYFRHSLSKRLHMTGRIFMSPDLSRKRIPTSHNNLRQFPFNISFNVDNVIMLDL